MGRSDRNWLVWLLAVMSVEKVVQHVIVTGALLADWGGLRQAVAVDWRWLATVGGMVGVMFAVALIGLLRSRPWSLTLLSGLALVDVIGEFVAQGTAAITITVSLVVALAVLGVSRHLATRTYPQSSVPV
jgi:hypothetical protein